MSDTDWTVGDLRFLRNAHDPALQEGNAYERCALCHYTRHPCDVHDLACLALQQRELIAACRRELEVVKETLARVRSGHE